MPSPSPNSAKPTTQEYLSAFRMRLAASLADPDTDPQAAVTEAAHASGLHAHVQQLEQEVKMSQKQIELATAKLGVESTPASGAATERDPRTQMTAFQAAAPVLESQSKARARRALAISGLEVGLVVLAIWAAVVLTRDPLARAMGDARGAGVPGDGSADAGAPEKAAAATDLTIPRLALWLGIVLMILSGMSGIVYLS